MTHLILNWHNFVLNPPHAIKSVDTKTVCIIKKKKKNPANISDPQMYFYITLAVRSLELGLL